MAEGDLTNLGVVGPWLNMDSAQWGSDVLLPGMISAFSAFFLKLIGRPAILEASYSERRNGTGTNTLGLINVPVLSVSSVVISNVNVPASPDGVLPGYVADEYTIQLIGGNWNGTYFPSSPGVATGYPGVFWRGVGNVLVAYSAGYQTVPLDVQQCVTEMVAWAYRYKDRIGLSSQTTPAVFVNSYSQRPLSPMAALCVERYKKKAVQW